ncbi:hypothetical protein NOS3756_07020 [Nostoc sp. NIES-3756]|uniref:hypothetical protein n=1 Tax=Nostoc sp. NIES-3756 TaxID=1751286 RepID=UPI0007220F6C|nr:hypothetical protein [Nostoc sp. NIES-3756]BAT51773.1 hypothetical protein NOS3756_07020 [Nostoc sp. NIES-3756]
MQNRTPATDSIQTPDADRGVLSNGVNYKGDIQPKDIIQSKSRDLLNKFVSSVQILVNDITALEVNTMIVANITGNKFNAWEAYQEIYSINDKDYFTVKEIPEDSSLRERYKSLFEQLEREYFYIILENKELHNRKIEQYHRRLQFKKDNKDPMVESDPRYVELARPILPPPTPVTDQGSSDNQNERQREWEQNLQEIQVLLSNDKFVRSLRKIAELKAALDGGNVKSARTDTIYAQTVMQLDGDIITRYHKDLFGLPEETKNLILRVHNEGVVSGEKQWHGVLDFMINLVRDLANLSINGRK